MDGIRHKCFISYHHDDPREVDRFIARFDLASQIFMTRAIGMTGDVINSSDVDYVMSRIRQVYLGDATVTLVMIGRCTRARRYVDWEIQSSLRRGGTTTPNGLLGIKLPSYNGSGYPDRLNKNLKNTDSNGECYARVIDYPGDLATLSRYIEDAFQARTARAHLIVNPRNSFVNNRSC